MAKVLGKAFSRKAQSPFATESRKTNLSIKKQPPVKRDTCFKDDRQILTSIQNLIYFLIIIFEMFLC